MTKLQRIVLEELSRSIWGVPSRGKNELVDKLHMDPERAIEHLKEVVQQLSQKAFDKAEKDDGDQTR